MKAVSAQANPDTPGMHRQEGRILAALEPLVTSQQLPVPRLYGTVDHPPWMALVLQDVPGRQPELPWQAAELQQVVVALDQLAELEATWAGHAAGDTLLHADIRADNILLTSRGAVVVDWPWACRGAAFTDLVLFAPSVATQGGLPPPDLLALSQSGRAADPQAVTALVCGLAGYLTERSLRPPPPGLPTVRAFQAAQATIARHWLKRPISPALASQVRPVIVHACDAAPDRTGAAP